jgi:protein-S-isoprenylcysteine O-methyltransferase Ste14
MREIKLRNNYIFGLVVLLILVALLVIEFLVASIDLPDWIIYLFGFLQAGIILWNYMHVDRFFITSVDDNQENK